jgi:uncharacterized protein YndB with AHSA1/START domain
VNKDPSVEPIVIETQVRASAARVFEALTDPSQRVLWWRAAGKFQADQMESDLRPGGLWLMRGSAGGAQLTIRGEYRVIEPPRVLEFTWKPSWPEVTTILRFELAEQDGVTTVRLTHSGFDRPQVRGRYQGWPFVLSSLRDYVEPSTERSV